MNPVTYPLTGLHCGARIRRITDALSPLAAQVNVTLAPMKVVLTDASADLTLLQAAMRSAGAYKLLPAKNF